MRPLELTRRGVLGTVAVLVVAGVCIRLGVWQLDRRAERQARNQVIAERMAMEPITLGTTAIDTSFGYRRANLTGRVDDDRAIVLAGRSRNGAPGVHVLSPVRLGAGAVLVNRGWLPARDGATVDLDAVRLHGAIRAEGVLVPYPAADVDIETDEFRVRWFRVDGDAIRAQYPYPVADLYLVATARPEPTAADGTTPAVMPQPAADSAADGWRQPAPLDPPTVDPGPHLSYAIQWFSFATVFLVGWVVLLMRRPRLQGRGEGPASPGDDAAPRPS